MTRTTLNESIEAAGHPILLETPAQLFEAQQEWQKSTLLGIDTEFVRERTYRAALGLIQVSDGRTAWLVDPVKIDSLEPVQDLLENSGITKILHSGSEDLEVLFHTVGALPAPLVDTQVACAMLGQSLQMGYHATVQWLFDIEVDKDQTRSNWCKRPLTERQLHYAAMDVVLLPRIAETLIARLEEKGRLPWMQEELERARQNANRTVDPDLAYLRISGAGRLDSESLRALRALAAWRENAAVQRNLARGFIVSDAGLLDLARSRPTTVRAARNLEGIHPRALDRYGKHLLATLEAAAADTTAIYRPEPLNAAQRREINAMRDVVQKRADELGVEPALLASRKELERLLRARMEGKEMPERFQGWRKDVLGNELL
jgi:ribonuclease D